MATLGAIQMPAPTVVRDVYSGVGPAWSNGPAAAYERMAAAAVARLPSTLTGWRVLDLGAGTDAEHLPFHDACFDAVIAAFSLSHPAQPAIALAEARRVLRPAGHLLSVSFLAEPAHPAKACVDAAAERFGFRPPAWYAHLKELEAGWIRPRRCARWPQRRA